MQPTTSSDQQSFRVLLADDHPVVRRGIREILEEEPDLEVVAETGNADDTVAEARRHEPDVVVLDLAMPGTQGVDLLRRLCTDGPETRVLVLSIYPEDQYSLRCLKAGARGYLEKNSAPEALVEAVRTVLAGRRYLSPSLAERLVELADEGAELRHESLSEREFQVLCRIASGQTTSEIAAALGIGVKTVSTYRYRLLAKMGMSSNAELTRYAFEHQLLG